MLLNLLKRLEIRKDLPAQVRPSGYRTRLQAFVWKKSSIISS